MRQRLQRGGQANRQNALQRSPDYLPAHRAVADLLVKEGVPPLEILDVTDLAALVTFFGTGFELDTGSGFTAIGAFSGPS